MMDADLERIFRQAFATFALVVALAAVAGCTTPTPTALSSEGVTIKYDPGLYDLHEVTKQANQLCGKYGKQAKFNLEHQNIPGIGFKYASFDCVEP